VPVLAMLGDKDSIVPVEPNARLLKTMMAANPNAKVVVVAGINHVGMIAKTGTLEEYPTLERFDPAFFKTFGDWLDARAR
jgi:pimeloyl-ACP methyl ester carboxylesterase